jgi:hypothetical protein
VTQDVQRRLRAPYPHAFAATTAMYEQPHQHAKNSILRRFAKGLSLWRMKRCRVGQLVKRGHRVHANRSTAPFTELLTRRTRSNACAGGVEATGKTDRKVR